MYTSHYRQTVIDSSYYIEKGEDISGECVSTFAEAKKCILMDIDRDIAYLKSVRRRIAALRSADVKRSA